MLAKLSLRSAFHCRVAGVRQKRAGNNNVKRCAVSMGYLNSKEMNCTLVKQQHIQAGI